MEELFYPKKDTVPYARTEFDFVPDFDTDPDSDPDTDTNTDPDTDTDSIQFQQ